MIAWPVKTFDCIVTGQEAVCFHAELPVTHLHGKGSAQVNDIGIADIRELGIGKACRVFFPKTSEFRFPKKINELFQSYWRRYAVIIFLKMVNIKKFDMLHVT